MLIKSEAWLGLVRDSTPCWLCILSTPFSQLKRSFFDFGVGQSTFSLLFSDAIPRGQRKQVACRPAGNGDIGSTIFYRLFRSSTYGEEEGLIAGDCSALILSVLEKETRKSSGT